MTLRNELYEASLANNKNKKVNFEKVAIDEIYSIINKTVDAGYFNVQIDVFKLKFSIGDFDNEPIQLAIDYFRRQGLTVKVESYDDFGMPLSKDKYIVISWD